MNRRLMPYAPLPEDPAVPPAGGGPAPVPPAVPAPPAPPAPSAGRTFTQAELDEIVGRTRGQAERAAKAALVSQFGFATTEEATAALTAAKAAADAQKTADQRALEAQQKADQATAALTAQGHALRVERALYAAGVQPVLPDGTPNPAVAMAARLVDAAPAADDAAVSAAVAAVKTSVPIWFTPPAVTAPPVLQPGPGPLPGQQPGNGQSYAEMLAVARQVHGLPADKAS